MAIELSFQTAYRLVKADYPDLIDDLDVLAGLVLLVTVALTAPPITAAALAAALGTLSNVFTVKSEFPKIGKKIIEKLAGKRESDPLALQRRMETAYCLICYAAFFEALQKEKQLAQIVRQVKPIEEDKLALAKKAMDALRMKDVPAAPATGRTTADRASEGGEFRWLDAMITFPHPVEALEEQCKRLQPLYNTLAKGMQPFLEQFAAWERADEHQRSAIRRALEKLPEQALACFRAEYYFLAARCHEFYVWADLQQRDDARKLLASLPTYLKTAC